MPMVPVITPVPKNTPYFSRVERCVAWPTYQIRPNRLTNCSGVQISVTARCQNSSAPSVCGSALSRVVPITASSTENRYQVNSGVSRIQAPPLTAPSQTTGIRPSDTQNGSAAGNLALGGYTRVPKSVVIPFLPGAALQVVHKASAPVPAIVPLRRRTSRARCDEGRRAPGSRLSTRKSNPCCS